jgi:hypothetical protein
MQLKHLWEQTYAAFAGAFDTPISRRRQNDEYSIDARQRMRAFNEIIENIPEGYEIGLIPIDRKPELKAE